MGSEMNVVRNWKDIIDGSVPDVGGPGEKPGVLNSRNGGCRDGLLANDVNKSRRPLNLVEIRGRQSGAGGKDKIAKSNPEEGPRKTK